MNKLLVQRLYVVRDPDSKYSLKDLTSPRAVADFVRDYSKVLDDVEHFFVIPLSNKNRPIGVHIAGQGTINSVIATPREIFKAAILANAASVILAHTHPSGQATPSREDDTITRNVADSGRLLDIKVLDHVVVGIGSEDYYSYAEKGQL